jgi:hypothetical protein
MIFFSVNNWLLSVAFGWHASEGGEVLVASLAQGGAVPAVGLVKI